MKLDNILFPQSSGSLVSEAEMNDTDGPLTYRPFGFLGVLLKDKVPGAPAAKKSSDLAEKPAAPFTLGPWEVMPPSTEKEIFQDAMKGVKPLKKPPLHLPRPIPSKGLRSEPLPRQGEADVRQCLEELVKYGKGLVLAQTPEYMEGTGSNVPRAFAQRLHQGAFSIEAYLDLHGLGVVTAREALENFLTDCLVLGKRAVMIIHGRGISSPKEPVLKNKLREWLTRTHWRKWVVAFASARSCDGGTGATYVLLRSGRVRKPPRLKVKDGS